MKTTFGVIILAGGKSERMVYPKPFLLLNGKTFLQNIAEEYYNSEVKESCLVINEEFSEGSWKSHFEQIKPYIKNIEKTDPIQGRFHSIKLGIKNVLRTDFVFIHNIDNPFISSTLIKKLQRHSLVDGYTQLHHQGHHGHPVLISQKIISHINGMKDNDHNLRNVLKGFPEKNVETDEVRILANLNTDKEYKSYIEDIGGNAL